MTAGREGDASTSTLLTWDSDSSTPYGTHVMLCLCVLGLSMTFGYSSLLERVIILVFMMIPKHGQIAVPET